MMINIDGVTVLNVEPIKDYNNLSMAVVILGLAIAVIACIAWGIKYRNHTRVEFSKAIPLLVAVVIGTAIAIFGMTKNSWFYTDTDKNTYVCIIDDNASFLDVYNNYDIVDAKGKYYTLADKLED